MPFLNYHALPCNQLPRDDSVRKREHQVLCLKSQTYGNVERTKNKDLIVSPTVPVKHPDWEVMGFSTLWPVWQMLLTELHCHYLCFCITSSPPWTEYDVHRTSRRRSPVAHWKAVIPGSIPSQCIKDGVSKGSSFSLNSPTNYMEFILLEIFYYLPCPATEQYI